MGSICSRRSAKCVDTDGNGSRDHCGSGAGRLCNANKTNPDQECTTISSSTSPTRGLCTTAPAQKKCTGAPNLNCSLDADCNRHCSLALTRSCNAIAGSVNNTCTLATQGTCIDDSATNGTTSLGERCVPNPTFCNIDADCGANGPCVHATGNNREGVNNCVFEDPANPGPCGNNCATSQEPYGLAQPPDDDLANGYCGRNDSLSGFDKSIPCSSPNDCNFVGAPYGTARVCSILTTKTCTSNTDCLAGEGTCALNVCSLLTTKACTSNTDCTAGQGTCSVLASGAYAAVCNKPDAGIDEFVTKNGPGRNYGIQVSNGPDMRFTTLEDFYGDTGNDFRAALGFNNREPDNITISDPPRIRGGRRRHGHLVEGNQARFGHSRLLRQRRVCHRRSFEHDFLRGELGRQLDDHRSQSL